MAFQFQNLSDEETFSSPPSPSLSSFSSPSRSPSSFSSPPSPSHSSSSSLPPHVVSSDSSPSCSSSDLAENQPSVQPQFEEENISSPSLHPYSEKFLYEQEDQQSQDHEQIDIRDPKKSPFLHGKFGTQAWNVSSSEITPINMNAGTLQETQIQFLKLLLLDPKFTFLHLLDDVLSAENVPVTSRMLLTLMHANNFVVPALDSMVEKEVLAPNLSSPQQLFKSDSLASNMITTFTSIMGAVYLHSLDDLITELITKAEDCELDPRRNENPVEIQRNQVKFLELATQLMEKLLAGLPDCPPELQHVTQILSLEVMGRFPDWPNGGYRAVGMLLFTRFVCVAIVRPEDFTLYKPSQILPGLTTSWSGKPTIKPKVRRTLAFLSKLIHNSVSNTKAKEPYLRFMDPFVQEYSPKVLEFCKRISSPAQGYEPPPLSDQMKINNSAMRHVVTVFSNNFEKIEAKNTAPPLMLEQFEHFMKEIKNTNYIMEGGAKKMETSSTTKMLTTKTSAAAGAGVGAAIGGAVGTVLLPGVGTVVGVAVGGALSGAGLLQIGHNQKAKKEREVFQSEMASVWDEFQHHTSCFLCYSVFSYTNRKHHCRACGHVVCNACSRKRTHLQGIEWGVRVCDPCFMLFPIPQQQT